MLTEIKIEKLYPHPQNPRKDIGDISELAESIKNQGVFQNLTVIKGGAGVPEGEEGYTVIIGHRRLAASKRAYELRREFAESITNAIAKKHFADIVTFAFYSGAMWGTARVEDEDVLKLLNLEWQFDEDENSFINCADVEAVVKKEPERMLWLMIYENTGDSERQTYHEYWECKHKENAELSALYDLLIKLGYEISDEERQLCDGTHRLFTKDDE